MDRRILFLLAAVAGISAFVLLLPDREPTPDPVAERSATEPDPTDGEAQPVVTRLDHGTEVEGLPPEKTEARAAHEARRASPYYRHAADTARYWFHLGNVLTGMGAADDAELARAVGRKLKTGQRPEATEEARQEAWDEERQAWQELSARHPTGEAGELLAQLGGRLDGPPPEPEGAPAEEAPASAEGAAAGG